MAVITGGIGNKVMQSSLAQEARQAILLLTEYAFELGRQEPTAQVVQWLEIYRPSWIRDAVVEALYQGRYKAISVQQILALWQRRGQPVRHSTKEFERTIAQPLGVQITASLPAPSRLPTQDRLSAGDTVTGTTSAARGPVPQADSSASASLAGDRASQSVEVGLDQLPDWDTLSPPFVPAQPAMMNGSDAFSSTPSDSFSSVGKRKQPAELLQAGLSAITADQGVLTSAHRPIQHFRPQLPFPNRRYRR